MSTPNHYSIQNLPPEVLLKLFNKLKLSSENKYQDLVSCQSVCTNWRAILTGSESVNWLFEQILPLVYPYISRSDLLNLRLVSKPWCHDVNNFRNKMPRHLCKALYLSSSTDFVYFLNDNEPPVGNPFIDRDLTITWWDADFDPEYCAARLLEKFGNQMRNISFLYDGYGSIQYVYYSSLIRLMQEALTIQSLAHIDVNIAAGSGVDVEPEYVDRVLEQFPLPDNSTLKSFSFAYDTWSDPTPLLQPILQSVCSSLEVLTISCFVYVCMDYNDGLHSLSNLDFPKLRQLEISIENAQMMERLLINLKRPPYESPLEAVKIYVYKPATLTEFKSLFGVIQGFSGTLLDLKLSLKTEETAEQEVLINQILPEFKGFLTKCKRFSVDINYSPKETN